MPYADKSTRKAHIKPLTNESVQKTLELLKDGRMRTVSEMCYALRYSTNTAHTVLKSLEFHEQAHLNHYAKISGGGNAAMWAFGPGERAPTPPKQTREERLAIQAEFRKRYKDPRPWGGKTQREAARNAAPVFRHPWDVWLFGECQASQATKWVGRVIRQSMSINDEETEAAA